jgi:hypothetical protein
MARNEPRPDPDAGGALDRLGETLRAAWKDTEDSPLEEETRRLMLHLSIEPLEPARQWASGDLRGTPRRSSLLRRLLYR